jgi:isoleucyl-tRNA synthetase
VKSVLLVEGSGESAPDNLVKRLKLNARAVGKRLGREAQTVFQAVRENDWVETVNGVRAGGADLLEDEYTFLLESSGDDTATAALPGGGVVTLDTELTNELENEGLSRDVLRAVQNARRSADLNVSDRVHLSLLFASESDREAFLSGGVDVAAEALAVTMTVSSNDSGNTLETDYVETVAAGEYATQSGFRVGLTVAR